MCTQVLPMMPLSAPRRRERGRAPTRDACAGRPIPSSTSPSACPRPFTGQGTTASCSAQHFGWRWAFTWPVYWAIPRGHRHSGCQDAAPDPAATYRARRLANTTTPMRPRPKRAKVVGSGTSGTSDSVWTTRSTKLLSAPPRERFRSSHAKVHRVGPPT